MNASIIIPSHDRAGDLRELLDALAELPLDERGVEVLVVDDASSDGTPDIVRAEFPWVRLLAQTKNIGPAAARNAGARAAGGGLLLFLDSDGVPGAGWLDAMLDAGDGDTVLLGCPVDYEGGRVQSVPRRATFLGKSLACAPERANSGPSCNLGFPAARFEAIGGFDEEIPYYFEDSDLCIRARKAGCAFKYLPEAVFRHKGTERKKGDAVRMQERNSTYAMLKAYRGRPLRMAAFIAANALWCFTRLCLWTLRGRFNDARRLFRGWVQGHARFLRSVQE